MWKVFRVAGYTSVIEIVKDPTSIYTLFMQKLIIRFFVSFHSDPGLVFYHDSVVITAESWVEFTFCYDDGATSLIVTLWRRWYLIILRGATFPRYIDSTDKSCLDTSKTFPNKRRERRKKLWLLFLIVLSLQHQFLLKRSWNNARRLGGRQEKFRYCDSSKLFMLRADPLPSLLATRWHRLSGSSRQWSFGPCGGQRNKPFGHVMECFRFPVDSGMINARLGSRRTLDSRGIMISLFEPGIKSI